MIAIHFLQYLHNEGLGVIDTDLFAYELPLGLGQYVDDRQVIAVIEAGGDLGLKKNPYCRQTLEVWVRSPNGSWVSGEQYLDRLIRKFKSECFCTLPAVTDGCCPNPKVYRNVMIIPLGNVESLGSDSENNMLFRSRFDVSYICDDSDDTA